jgi:hypothetical protein
MAETSEQIRRDLERTRARVGGTIAALERKVNPRHVLDDHPVAAVGAAFGVGVLLGATGAPQKAVVGAAHEVREQFRSGAEHASRRTGNIVDELVQTVLSTASAAITAKLTQALGNILPSTNDGAHSSRSTPRRYVGTDVGTGRTADTRSDSTAA